MTLITQIDQIGVDDDVDDDALKERLYGTVKVVRGQYFIPM